MRRSFAAALTLAAALACAMPAAAQQADDDRAAWTAGDEDRSTVVRFLEREDVAAAAGRMGYDVHDIARAALELDDANAARVAGELNAAEQALAADTITFTTTTLLIILLVLLIIIIAAD